MIAFFYRDVREESPGDHPLLQQREKTVLLRICFGARRDHGFQTQCRGPETCCLHSSSWTAELKFARGKSKGRAISSKGLTYHILTVHSGDKTEATMGAGRQAVSMG